jgi:SAM-dependent methyltransferase
MSTRTGGGADPATIWHDVECASYSADLRLWEELAEAAGGPVLELGCGAGRVVLHLARRGHEALGVDRDPALIAALGERASDLPARGYVVDGRDFDLGRPVALALAPMQFLQLLGSSAERISCMSAVARHLPPGGLLAAALVEGLEMPADPAPPIPDVREVDGWIYSSLPTAVVAGEGEIVLRRLRQTVSPSGELTDEENEIALQTFPADQLEVEAAAAGLRPAGRRRVRATESHVGSIVVLLAKEGD